MNLNNSKLAYLALIIFENSFNESFIITGKSLEISV